ncbi:NAD(P)-dependent oxidoreductase [Sphingomonas sp.]|uniref:NAD(P)-dependent oxidoreductase n=1 Tax=Sphingomonas sp. TaxID=28214 RepID=UPI002E360064|nr:NAD(P)-dependent oxidoreductase [Sphingomonas sp.]HEX4695952.1 NAD(P)-dependent oxidoreductase [Sphingomonas sp.]
MKAVLPALARPLLEPQIPAGIHVSWFATREEAGEMIVNADIAWVDMQRGVWTAEAVAKATRLKWLSTIFAGIDFLDLEALRANGTVLTNGTGINALAVAEYAVMGVLVAAKRYDEVVRLADKHEWTLQAPGQVELFETKALIVGMGAIGKLIAERLAAFGVDVTGVTRSGRDGTLKPDQWQAKLGAFDWVILAAPSTDSTKAMIGAAELAAMKPSAWLINIARGDMIEEAALLDALNGRKIAGAFLDPTYPEPLPPEHPLWSAPNCLITMHLSGRSQTKMFPRAAALFLRNLDALVNGRPMENVVDLEAGY